MSQTASTLLTVAGDLSLVALGAVAGSLKCVKARDLPWLGGALSYSSAA